MPNAIPDYIQFNQLAAAWLMMPYMEPQKITINRKKGVSYCSAIRSRSGLRSNPELTRYSFVLYFPVESRPCFSSNAALKTQIFIRTRYCMNPIRVVICSPNVWVTETWQATLTFCCCFFIFFYFYLFIHARLINSTRWNWFKCVDACILSTGVLYCTCSVSLVLSWAQLCCEVSIYQTSIRQNCEEAILYTWTHAGTRLRGTSLRS